MKLSARTAMKTRQDSKRLSGFGKMWTLGTKAKVFYPLVVGEDGTIDILVSACWGYSISPKETGLKRIFIPSNSEVVDGEPQEADILYQFSKLAPLFIQGARKEKEAKLAKKVGLSQSDIATAMKKIEEEFANISPVVGRLKYVVSTECVFVPLNSDGTPDMEKARLVSQDLSDNRIQELIALIDNPQYGITAEKIKGGERWLEVDYAFGSTGDRKVDGKVSPTGVNEEFKQLNKSKDDDAIVMKLTSLLNTLPEDDSTIFKRNSSFRKMPEAQIKAGLRVYAQMSSECLDSLESEEDLDRLSRVADTINDLQIPITNSVARDKIDEAIAKAKEAGAPQFTKLIDKEDIEHAKEEQKDNVNEDLASGEEDALKEIGVTMES